MNKAAFCTNRKKIIKNLHSNGARHPILLQQILKITKKCMNFHANIAYPRICAPLVDEMSFNYW